MEFINDGSAAEDYTQEHDAAHSWESLADAGICYGLSAVGRRYQRQRSGRGGFELMQGFGIHDAHKMYAANEQMCFRCGAIRRLTDPIQPGEKMPHWRLGGEKMPHCPEGGSNTSQGGQPR